MDVSPDREKLVSGGMDHCVRIYDIHELKEEVIYHGEDIKHTEHFNRIFSVKIDPSNSNIIYSGGWDKEIITHDVREKHSVGNFMGPYIAGDTIDVYGYTLLAGSYRTENPIEVYDIRTGEVLNTIQWNDDKEDKKGGMIMSCQFGNPASHTVLAGSSSSHELRLFDRVNDKTLCTASDFSGPVIATHLSHNGGLVACGTKTGGLVLLSYNQGKVEAS